jgi:hypothetical protein
MEVAGDGLLTSALVRDKSASTHIATITTSRRTVKASTKRERRVQKTLAETITKTKEVPNALERKCLLHAPLHKGIQRLFKHFLGMLDNVARKVVPKRVLWC